MVVDIENLSQRVYQLGPNGSLHSKNIIAKYNKNINNISKYYEVNGDEDDKERGIYTNGKTVTIDGIKGMNSIVLDFSNIEENYELEVDKDLLFEEEGENNNNKLTFNSRAVEKVDVSDVVVKIGRDPVTKEITKEYEVTKNVNRSKGKNRRKDIILEDEILPDIAELFNTISFDIDEKAINAGMYGENKLDKIVIFGEEKNVRGNGILTYVNRYKYYKVDCTDVDTLYLFWLRVHGHEAWLCYKKIVCNEDYYYFGNQTKDYNSDESYFITAVSAAVVENNLYNEDNIMLINTEGELIGQYTLHADISETYFNVNEDEHMLRGTYTIYLRNIDVGITGDSLRTQEIVDVNITENCTNYVVVPNIGFDYMEGVRINVDVHNPVTYKKYEYGGYQPLTQYQTYKPPVYGIFDNVEYVEGSWDDNSKCMDIYEESTALNVMKHVVLYLTVENDKLYLNEDKFNFDNSGHYYFGHLSSEQNCYFIGYLQYNDVKSNRVFKILDETNNIVKTVQLNLDDEEKFSKFEIGGDDGLWAINLKGNVYPSTRDPVNFKCEKIRIIDESAGRMDDLFKIKRERFEIDISTYDMYNDSRWNEFIDDDIGENIFGSVDYSIADVYIYMKKDENTNKRKFSISDLHRRNHDQLSYVVPDFENGERFICGFRYYIGYNLGNLTNDGFESDDYKLRYRVQFFDRYDFKLHEFVLSRSDMAINLPDTLDLNYSLDI